MDPFELIKIMFENPEKYKTINIGDKRKNFFIVQRRLSIQYPLQCQALQHIKINDISVTDFWQNFISKQYNKVPYWMFIKGVKKTNEHREKELGVKENTIREFSIYYNYDIKSVREALLVFPEEMKKEINTFEKTIMS
jgi:hypothetical protein